MPSDLAARQDTRRFIRMTGSGLPGIPALQALSNLVFTIWPQHQTSLRLGLTSSDTPTLPAIQEDELTNAAQKAASHAHSRKSTKPYV